VRWVGGEGIDGGQRGTRGVAGLEKGGGLGLITPGYKKLVEKCMK